jgi:hypothetical protein
MASGYCPVSYILFIHFTKYVQYIGSLKKYTFISCLLRLSLVYKKNIQVPDYSLEIISILVLNLLRFSTFHAFCFVSEYLWFIPHILSIHFISFSIFSIHTVSFHIFRQFASENLLKYLPHSAHSAKCTYSIRVFSVIYSN